MDESAIVCWRGEGKGVKREGGGIKPVLLRLRGSGAMVTTLG